MRKLPPTVRLPRFHRRHPVGLLAALGLCFLVVFGRLRGPAVVTPAPFDDFARYHERVFRVAKVVDGDTIDIDHPDRDKTTTRIRLWGVDTPEVAGSRDGAMHWGDRASQFAGETLADREVRIDLIERGTRDRYDRLLAYVYVVSSGEMFNELLVRRGHAYADTRFAHPYMARFRSLEADARADGVGLWAEITPEQMPPWRRRRER